MEKKILKKFTNKIKKNSKKKFQKKIRKIPKKNPNNFWRENDRRKKGGKIFTLLKPDKLFCKEPGVDL